MTQPIRRNRRSFLRSAVSTTAVAASAFAAPMILPRRVFGANERIAVGAIGVKNQGSGNIKRFLGAGADVVAICDVDSNVAAAAVDIVKKGHPEPKTFGDYRQLLEEKGIDAVVITTPDHWHALMTIDACKAGKDVYCEKPLSLTIAEGDAWSMRLVSTSGSFKLARSSDRRMNSGEPVCSFEMASSATSRKSSLASRDPIIPVRSGSRDGSCGTQL